MFNHSTLHHLKANLRHANLSNDEKKSEGEDFAAAEKAEEEEVRRSVFARNYRCQIYSQIFTFFNLYFNNVLRKMPI